MATSDLLVAEKADRHPRRARPRISTRAFVSAVGLVVLVQIAVSAYLLQRSFFFSEDFMYFQLFGDEPTSYELLTRNLFGHLVPAFVLWTKYYGLWVGPSWAIASLVTVAVQLAGTVAFARLVLALRGRPTWLGVWLTAAFGLSVIGLNTVPWWAATWTMQITMVTAVSTWGCAVRYARTRRSRHLVSLALAYTLSIGFFEKSLATSAYVFLFFLVVGLGSDAGLRERVRRTVALWPVWVVIAAISIVDLGVYARGDYLASAGEPVSLTTTGAYLLRSYPEGVFPSLMGAVYPVSNVPGPTWLTWVLATVIALSLVVGTSLRSRVARRVWAWYFLVTLFSQYLVARGRLGVIDIDTVVHQLRYQGDMHYLFLIGLAVAVPSALTGSAPQTQRVIAGLAVVATALATPLWLQSIRSISDASPGKTSKAFFAELRSGLLPPDARFLDMPVVGWIVPPAMYPWNMAGRVYPIAQPGTEITNDPNGALWIRPDGTIGPVQLRDLTRAAPRRVCLDEGGLQTQILRSPVGLRTAADPTLLTFDYTTEGETQALVTLADGVNQMDVRGTGEPFTLTGNGTLTTVVVPGRWRTALLTITSGDPVCVRSVRLTTPYG